MVTNVIRFDSVIFATMTALLVVTDVLSLPYTIQRTQEDIFPNEQQLPQDPWLQYLGQLQLGQEASSPNQQQDLRNQQQIGRLQVGHLHQDAEDSDPWSEQQLQKSEFEPESIGQHQSQNPWNEKYEKLEPDEPLDNGRFLAGEQPFQNTWNQQMGIFDFDQTHNFNTQNRQQDAEPLNIDHQQQQQPEALELGQQQSHDPWVQHDYLSQNRQQNAEPLNIDHQQQQQPEALQLGQQQSQDPWVQHDYLSQNRQQDAEPLNIDQQQQHQQPEALQLGQQSHDPWVQQDYLSQNRQQDAEPLNIDQQQQHQQPEALQLGQQSHDPWVQQDYLSQNRQQDAEPLNIDHQQQQQPEALELGQQQSQDPWVQHDYLSQNRQQDAEPLNIDQQQQHQQPEALQLGQQFHDLWVQQDYLTQNRQQDAEPLNIDHQHQQPEALQLGQQQSQDPWVQQDYLSQNRQQDAEPLNIDHQQQQDQHLGTLDLLRLQSHNSWAQEPDQSQSRQFQEETQNLNQEQDDKNQNKLHHEQLQQQSNKPWNQQQHFQSNQQQEDDGVLDLFGQQSEITPDTEIGWQENGRLKPDTEPLINTQQESQAPWNQQVERLETASQLDDTHSQQSQQQWNQQAEKLEFGQQDEGPLILFNPQQIQTLQNQQAGASDIGEIQQNAEYFDSQNQQQSLTPWNEQVGQLQLNHHLEDESLNSIDQQNFQDSYTQQNIQEAQFPQHNEAELQQNSENVDQQLQYLGYHQSGRSQFDEEQSQDQDQEQNYWIQHSRLNDQGSQEEQGAVESTTEHQYYINTDTEDLEVSSLNTDKPSVLKKIGNKVKETYNKAKDKAKAFGNKVQNFFG